MDGLDGSASRIVATTPERRDAGEERIEIPAADGYRLAATVFTPKEGRPCGAVLIVAALGVARPYYAAFARWLAGAQGFLVVTFDYRGIGESRRGSLRHLDADLLTWAGDAGAALDALFARAGNLPVTWIGHSLGGQIVPLVRAPERMSRVVMVTAGNGYWRINAEPTRWRAGILWYVIAPALLSLFGYFPGKRFRMVADLPRGVMWQWRRWCLHPDYLVGVEGQAVRARFAEVTIPIYSISFTDDEIMSAQSIESLHRLYAGAPRETVRVAPAEYGLRRIGHFGFFRRDMQDVLWGPIVLSRLERRAGP